MPMQKYSRNTVLKSLLFNDSKDKGTSPADSHALATLFRYQGTIEKIWKNQLTKPKGLPRPIQAILSLGVYELCFSKKEKAYATCSECVELAKKYSKGHSGLVNAVLKKISKLKINIEIEVQDNFPTWIVEKLENKSLENLLEEPQFVVGPQSQPELKTSLADYIKKGDVFVQSHSSRFVVDVLLQLLKKKEAATFLDLCAGKGGKFIGVAQELKSNPIQFFATDKSEHQLAVLKNALAKKELGGHVFSWNDFASQPSGFDVVVVDAPCSGSGTWAKNPRGKWFLTQKHLDQCLKTQHDLLEKGLGLTNPGGVLFYSVCSLFLEEAHLEWKTEELEPYAMNTEYLTQYGASFSTCARGGVLIQAGQGFEGFFLKGFNVK